MDKIKKLDGLRVQLMQITKDMKGINPKLSSYQKLKKLQDEIAEKINEIKSSIRTS